MRFTIRDLLFVTAIVALAVGWFMASVRYKANVSALKGELAAATTENAGLAASRHKLEIQLKLLEIQLRVQESPLKVEKKIVVESLK